MCFARKCNIDTTYMHNFIHIGRSHPAAASRRRDGIFIKCIDFACMLYICCISGRNTFIAHFTFHIYSVFPSVRIVFAKPSNPIGWTLQPQGRKQTSSKLSSKIGTPLGEPSGRADRPPMASDRGG